MKHTRRVSRLPLLFTLWTLSACSSPDRTTTESTQPREFSQEEFDAWRWMEGSWMVTDDVIRFYESYQYLNDSTIQILYFFDDSTLTNATDTVSVVFTRGNIYYHDDDDVSVATRGDSVSLEFVALENVEFSFSWFRETADLWRLSVQAGDSNEYRLERITPN